MSASPNAVMDQVQAQTGAELASAKANPPDPADILKQRDQALEPMHQEESAAFKDMMSTPQPGSAKLPSAPNQPLVDPNQYSKFSAALVAMAFLAGSKSKGNWLGVSSSLNGALKGYLEGNEQKAAEAWKKYQADYDKAIEQHKEQEQDYAQTINNKKLTINQMLQEMQWKAVKYDDQYTLALAKQKHIDELYKNSFGMAEAREKLNLQRENIDSQIKKRAESMASDGDPKVESVYAAMSDAGISFPPGMRSVKAQAATIKGLLAAHPFDTPGQIVARVRAGELGMKEKQTELGVVARREGSSASAINALNRPGGLYDQLTETAKKIDFGSSKTANNLELWKQGKVVADPDISEYVNALSDTRAEFASVLARGGQVTDSVRIASEHAFPDNLSLPELQRNVARSKKIADSIQAGNTAVADALINGKSMEEAMGAASTTPNGGAPKPYADPAKEQRYQEWKRAHPDL